MGNIGSGMVTETKYYQLKKMIDDLIQSYQIWTQDSICDQLVLFYQDKLLKFDRSSLTNLSLSIGIKPKEDIDKTALCQSIIEHYKKRIILLQNFWEGLERTQGKINQVKFGPICRSVDKYIKELKDCDSNKGVWIGQSSYTSFLNDMRKSKTYDIWLEHVRKLNALYYRKFNKLLKIIETLKKDIHTNVSDPTFDLLEQEANTLIARLDKISDVIYLVIVNNPV